MAPSTNIESMKIFLVLPLVVQFLLYASYTYAFSRFTPGGILLLDHLNINHEKLRHDIVKAFYYEVLGLAPDPRKQVGRHVWVD